MQNEIAPRHRLAPARIVDQIRGKEGQPIQLSRARSLQRGAHTGLPLQTPHRRPHLMPRRQQRQNRVASNKPRTARNQNRVTHRRSP